LLAAINHIKIIVAIAHPLAEADTTQVSHEYSELAKSNKKLSKEFGRQGRVDGMYIQRCMANMSEISATQDIHRDMFGLHTTSLAGH
jgi:hypothetical protein